MLVRLYFEKKLLPRDSINIAQTWIEFSIFSLILMGKNYPFYIILRYVVTFTSADRTLNEDLLQTLHKELNCEHSQILSTMYSNFVISYLHCHISSRLLQF